MSSSSSKLSLTIIAAVTRKNGLGVNGTLPWRLPKEMAHFRKATSATGSSSPTAMNGVIMGRKTWQSIPTKFRPLKGRINVVVSRTTGEEAETQLGMDGLEQTYLVSSLDSAVDLLQSRCYQLSRTFLIGGAQLYTQAMQSTPENAILDRLMITRIYDPTFDECDVFLPEFRTAWQVEQEESHHSATVNTNKQGKDNCDWLRYDDEELSAFVGEDVEKGTIEERGVRYELQMWKRVL